MPRYTNVQRFISNIDPAVERVWRENRCLTEGSIAVYRMWIRRFGEYCQLKKLDRTSQLTLVGARLFARCYSRRREVPGPRTFGSARSALGTYAAALRSLGEVLPPWAPAPSVSSSPTPLVNEFVQHLREHRGNPDSTIHKKTQHVQRFIAFLRVRRRRPQQSRLQDIDEFLIQCRRRYARATVADIGCTLRSFMRFLVATGRISADLAPSITTPIIRRLERPHRTLPWEDVQRILRAVDRSTPCGRRDYVLLLMMSTYGMGAGEVIRLTLDDVDWQSATVHVARPKTGVEFLLPLLPAVARALVSYLRKGRPHHADSPSVRDHARATPAVGLFGHHPTHPPHACAARGRFGTIPRHTRVSSHACVPANGVGDSNEGDWRHPGTS